MSAVGEEGVSVAIHTLNDPGASAPNYINEADEERRNDADLDVDGNGDEVHGP